MKKYEYKVAVMASAIVMSTKQFEKNAKEIEEKLNELGREGWELVQKQDGMFFFKREA